MIYEIHQGTSLWDSFIRWPEAARDMSPTRIETLRFSGDEVSALEDRRRVRIAIVGTHDPRLSDTLCVQRIVRSLSSATDFWHLKPVIISGLAIGIDTAAHTAALAYGLPTIAVLPSSLEHIYPHENIALAERIANSPGSELLSQYEALEEPNVVNFIERNKTIALLSDIVIVVASKRHGGALVVAKIAKDIGADVYAVPGNPDDTHHEGCNLLIRNGWAEMLPPLDRIKEILTI